MIALILSNILLFTAEAAGAGGHSAWQSFRESFDSYLNYPGFEIWKFVNLAIFIGLVIYAARYLQIPEWFRTQRDAIRSELLRAEEEKKAALARLTAIEARLAQLESEKESIVSRAKEESEAERRRLSEQTNLEIKRLREQADAEIARLATQTRAELRRFSADESVRLAEEKLRSQIGPADDARLVRASIQEIGGLN